MAAQFGIEGSAFPVDQSVQPIHTNARGCRGKKATIQLMDINDNDDGTSNDTVQLSAPGSGTSDPVSSPPPPRLKIVLGRVLSNPVVAYFDCTTPKTTTNGDDHLDPAGATMSSNNHYGPFQWFRKSASSSSSSSSSSFRVPKAVQSGAPKAVIQTMKQFPYQGRVQRLGCAALRDMAVDSWPAKRQVVDETPHSIETITKAMRIHLMDAKLQEIACACLYELVAGDLADTLVEKGVVTSVLKTMEHHPQDEDVLPVALKVLLALTDQGPAAVECLRHRLGGVSLAKLEHSFRGQNWDISKKAGELLRRLYI